MQQLFKVSGNYPKAIQRMEKFMQEKLWTLGKDSEYLWHLNHNLFYPPLYLRKMIAILLMGTSKNTGLYFPQLPVKAKFSLWEKQSSSTSHLTHIRAPEALLYARVAVSLRLPSATQSLLIEQKIYPRHGRPESSPLKFTGKEEVPCREGQAKKARG